MGGAIPSTERLITLYRTVAVAILTVGGRLENGPAGGDEFLPAAARTWYPGALLAVICLDLC
jgi:hypothetical protein